MELNASQVLALAASQQRAIDLVKSWADAGQLVKPGMVEAFAVIFQGERDRMLSWVGLDPEGNPLT